LGAPRPVLDRGLAPRDMKRGDPSASPSVPCSRVIITVAEH
jgi:hypothetical protein